MGRRVPGVRGSETILTSLQPWFHQDNVLQGYCHRKSLLLERGTGARDVLCIFWGQGRSALDAFKLKWEQGAAVSHLGEWGTLACCCKPSPLWWCSLPDVAAGVRDMPQHCIVMGRGTWDPGTPLAGDPLLSLGSAAVDCWQWQAMEGPSALPWKQSDGKFLGAWQAGWLRASLWPQPLADAAEKAVADKVRSSWDHDQSPWGAVSVFDHCSELAGGVTHQECVWSLLKSWVHLYSTGLLIKSHMWS